MVARLTLKTAGPAGGQSKRRRSGVGPGGCQQAACCKGGVGRVGGEDGRCGWCSEVEASPHPRERNTRETAVPSSGKAGRKAARHGAGTACHKAPTAWYSRWGLSSSGWQVTGSARIERYPGATACKKAPTSLADHGHKPCRNMARWRWALAGWGWKGDCKRRMRAWSWPRVCESGSDARVANPDDCHSALIAGSGKRGAGA